MKTLSHNALSFIRTSSQQAKRFINEDSGTSIAEFAMIAPFMVMGYLGFVAVAKGEHLSSRVNQVASTVSDIISQSDALSRQEIDAALMAGEAIAGAGDASNMTIEVVGVEIRSNGTTKVKWARGINPTNLPAKNGPFDLPPSLTKEPGFVVASRAALAYVPTIGHTVTGTLQFEHRFYFVPRMSPDTICNGC